MKIYITSIFHSNISIKYEKMIAIYYLIKSIADGLILVFSIISSSVLIFTL